MLENDYRLARLCFFGRACGPWGWIYTPESTYQHVFIHDFLEIFVSGRLATRLTCTCTYMVLATNIWAVFNLQTAGRAKKPQLYIKKYRETPI